MLSRWYAVFSFELANSRCREVSISVKAYEASHVIDGILTRQLSRECRVAVLEYVRAGYDGESGEFLGRTRDQDVAIRCLDCGSQMCEHCEVREVRNG